MEVKIKICKKHGELKEQETKIYIYKGHKRYNCRICDREYDRKRRSYSKRKEYEKNRKQKPDYKVKTKQYAENYKERRRIVNKLLYQRKKDDPDFKKKQLNYKSKSYEKMKSEMNDTYIKKCLHIHKNATPEMIQKKRFEILEFRKLKDQKEKLKILIKKQKEERIEYIKLNKIVKTCKKHGDLTINDTYLSKNGKVSDKRYYFCNICKKQSGKKLYHKYKEKHKERNKEYRKNNLDATRKRNKEWNERLSDRYVARRLTKNGILKFNEIPQDLINLLKSNIKLKRILRKNRNENQKN